LLKYLDAIERLPWRIYWGRLDLKTLDYPTIQILIELHTLSLDAEWIGV
jgi:MSHA biogenesis protein MshJ